MKVRRIFDDIREYENLHVALWLIKDACWVMTWRTAGMIMIVPTLAVAIHLAWRSRKNKTDLFHNVAICCWISANATWMTGEFFYSDSLRPFAMVLFAAGIIVVASYYTFIFPRRKQGAPQEVKIDQSPAYRSMNEAVKKVA